jgi:hypothetical protein
VQGPKRGRWAGACQGASGAPAKGGLQFSRDSLHFDQLVLHSEQATKSPPKRAFFRAENQTITSA